MKEIFVYGRRVIEALPPPEVSHIIVSINCPGEEPANVQTNEHTLGRVNLFFWDLDKVPEGYEGKQVRPNGMDVMVELFEKDLCQPGDATKIIDLIEAHPEVQHVLVHCTAGKSRSAGCAAALHHILNGSDEPIFGNKRYMPNMRVYRMVLNEWYDRHPQE